MPENLESNLSSSVAGMYIDTIPQQSLGVAKSSWKMEESFEDNVHSRRREGKGRNKLY